MRKKTHSALSGVLLAVMLVATVLPGVVWGDETAAHEDAVAPATQEQAFGGGGLSLR
jgi:hypothetical protein